MNNFLQEYGEYSQFIVLIIVLLLGLLVYGGYTYYLKQQNIKNVNDNLNNNLEQVQGQQVQDKQVQGKQVQGQQVQGKRVQGQQPILAFIPSEEFKGEKKGYKYGKGPKGMGYYLDEK